MGTRATIGPSAYASWRESELGKITESIEDALLMKLLGNVADRRILDVGCGDGALAVKLCQHGAHVTGIDPNAEMVRQAMAGAESAGASVEFVVAAGEHLPFAEASFDMVLAKTVLCFVEDAETMVREMARVLRPGGRLVIGELGKWSLWAVQRRIHAWLGSRLWQQGRFRTPGELRTLVAAAGLSVCNVHGAVYYPRSAFAARLMAPQDRRFGRMTNFGAAFLAMSAVKPSSMKEGLAEVGNV